MAVKKLKPITPGQRGRTVNSFETITTTKPEKSLLIPKKRTVGWIIYPLGYLFSPKADIIDLGGDGELLMGIAYNIADMINKIGFGVVAWMGAKKAAEATA